MRPTRERLEEIRKVADKWDVPLGWQAREVTRMLLAEIDALESEALEREKTNQELREELDLANKYGRTKDDVELIYKLSAECEKLKAERDELKQIIDLKIISAEQRNAENALLVAALKLYSATLNWCFDENLGEMRISAMGESKIATKALASAPRAAALAEAIHWTIYNNGDPADDRAALKEAWEGK